MTASPFFKDLFSAYQAELDDLSQDSEGKDVLKKRIADKRGEIDFLVNMMVLSPEMVAVVFHQAFAFKSPAAMDDLVSFEADELPDWSDLASSISIAPWAQTLIDTVLAEPRGDWFLSVSAGLEYMAGKPAPHTAQADEEAKDEDENELEGDAEERAEAKARKEAGDDWMVEQGFDRKD